MVLDFAVKFNRYGDVIIYKHKWNSNRGRLVLLTEVERLLMLKLC